MSKLILDFDGTITDIWPRYYHVFCDLAHERNLNFEHYRETKRRLHDDFKVAEKLGILLPEDYKKRKAELLEDLNYLEYDSLVISRGFLMKVFRNKDVIVLTRRRYPQNFRTQMTMLKIAPHHYVTIEKKESWIKKNITDDEVTIVGDSLNELEAAKLPNVRAYMVGYGLFTYEDFIRENIDFDFLRSPEELENVIRKWMKE